MNRLAAAADAVQVWIMPGRIASLYRYPVKGFTPEPLTSVDLKAGAYFPCDRLYAVENGPSGFDPAAPAFISKNRFTVLARIAKIACARTAYDEDTGCLSIQAQGGPPLTADLGTEDGRRALADWLAGFLDPEDLDGPLKVVTAPPHRFTDSPKGFVSVVNLASVLDLAARLGRPVDPLRFRANVYVDGWPAWSEFDWSAGAEVMLGAARATVLAPITRCVATHVDPQTGVRDMEIVPALRALYDHLLCGVYLSVTKGGRIATGDAAGLA